MMYLYLWPEAQSIIGIPIGFLFMPPINNYHPLSDLVATGQDKQIFFLFSWRGIEDAFVFVLTLMDEKWAFFVDIEEN